MSILGLELKTLEISVHMLYCLSWPGSLHPKKKFHEGNISHVIFCIFVG